MKWKFEEEFRLDKPETIRETDRHFDLYNYKDWLEFQLAEARKQLSLFAVSGRSELLLAFGKFMDADCDLLGSGYIEEMVKKFEASNSH